MNVFGGKGLGPCGGCQGWGTVQGGAGPVDTMIDRYD